MNKKVKNMVIWTSSSCNLNCKYCYAKNYKKKENMSFETFKNAMRYGDKEGLVIQLTGGEPLLNFPLIEEIHAYLDKENIRAKLSIQTNASLITDDIAKKMKDMKINVGVSLDGSIKVNESIRGETLNVIRGIETLSKNGIGINLNAVICKNTISSLVELVDLAFYLGNVRGIGLDLLRKVGEYEKNSIEIEEVSEEELIENLLKAYQRTKILEKESGKKIIIRDIDESLKRLKYKIKCDSYCYASLEQSMVVLPNGDTYPCGSLLNHKFFMGNVNTDEVTLKGVTNKEMDKCKSCVYTDYCPKGCPSRIEINKSNDLDCILKKTAFMIASQELDGQIHI